MSWRKLMASQWLSELQQVLLYAAWFFAEDDMTAGHIELSYPLLAVDPETGTSALTDLGQQWSSQTRPEVVYIFGTGR